MPVCDIKCRSATLVDASERRASVSLKKDAVYRSTLSGNDELQTRG
jgi:hypothetical protein